MTTCERWLVKSKFELDCLSDRVGLRSYYKNSGSQAFCSRREVVDTHVCLWSGLFIDEVEMHDELASDLFLISPDSRKSLGNRGMF